MFAKDCLKLLALIVVITAISASPERSWLGPEFTVVQKVYDDCQDKNDFIGCLKEKALTAVSKAIEIDTIKISDGLVLEKQNVTEKQSIIGLTDARTLNGLSKLDKSLLEKIDLFLRTHVLKFDIVEARGNDDSNKYDDGRAGGSGGGKHKHKKGGGGVKYVVAALLTAMGIAGPIGLKALAMIAGKALVISKVALTIAGIIALKKLFSHDGHEETSFQVHAGEHNRRNTFVVRPVNNNKPGGTVDPYRYYYEYH